MGANSGFKLKEIKALLALGSPGQVLCGEVRAISTRHLDAIRAKIADLRKRERLLGQTIDRCEGGTPPECPVLDILSPEPRQVS
ncbi:MerR family DNA-binding protein [Microvirga sp. VF16]|uniref:MerR family DNA-binding protein n=1 Tax=Microvirga sp. VF16 TaxID=2807101 RepID=UPI00193E9962|nr:MerR family DNA-binding protein [Microvirga sp. VF16]